MTEKSKSVKKPIKNRGKSQPKARLSLAIKSLLERANQARREFRYKEAVDLYTQAIDSGELDLAHKFDALLGRKQMQIDNFEAQRADVKQMVKLARALEDPIRQVRALIEGVNTAERKDADITLPKAKAALKKAHQLKNRELEADATRALGVAYFLRYENQAAAESFRQALSMHQAISNDYGVGLSLAALGFSLSSLGNVNEATKYSQWALDIFRNIGDRANEAQILRSLGLLTNDFVDQLDLHNRSLQIYQELGLIISAGFDYNNLSISYTNLGLYRKAREQGEMSVQIMRNHNHDGLSFALESLSRPYLSLRDYEKATQLLNEGLAIARKQKFSVHEASYLHGLGRLAKAQGKIKEARKYLQASLKISQQSSNELDISSAQAWLAAIELALGNEKAARKHSAQAVAQLEKTENNTFDYPPQEVWWWRYKVLAKTKSKEEAFEALQKAHQLMLHQVVNISDEGLRRNYLNKVEINREIMLEWAKMAKTHKRPLELPETRVGSLAEQLQRVTEFGTQLNEHHDEDALLQLILDEVVELSGAERAFLLLEKNSELIPVAGYLLIQKELTLLAAETTQLTVRVARSRQPILSEETESTSKKKPPYLRRMSLAVPLLLRGQLLGVLYVDMRRLFGKLNDEDLNLLSVLCNQAASALENARLVSGLEHKVQERTAELIQSNKVQSALYKIADAASSSHDLQEFYAQVHQIVGELMYAENFLIAIYDEQSGLVSFPYFADEKDEAPETQPLANFRGVTGYAIRTGKTVGHGPDQYDELFANKEVELIGTRSEDGIVAPLKSEGKILGAIFVQTYAPEIRYTDQDDKVLEFVAQHIATALTRARALEAERQRTDELAILNSVGEAMARTLDVKTVTKIVGDKVRDIFSAEAVSINLLDSSTNLIHPIYEYDKGEGGYIDYMHSFPLGKGLNSKVIQSRQPLLLGTLAEQIANGAYATPEQLEQDSGVTTQSWIGVPIMINDKVLGTVNISHYREHAYNESHLRLLQTLASNMSVAIENARLFEAEQQRVAELQIINTVQTALASKLDIQAIYDLIGDKIREIFDAQGVIITSFDYNTENIIYNYYIKDKRYYPQQKPFTGLVRHLIDKRQTVLINQDIWEHDKKLEMHLVAGEPAKSMVFVPLLVGETVSGYIGLHNLERENAFRDSDVRLLETLANSMSVALENARLFDETQRLFKAEQQRAAELAIINSVQAALAAELSIQGIYDAVGDKIRDIFHNTDMSIRIYDPKTDLVHFPYYYEKGERIAIEPIALGDRKGFTPYVLRTRETIVVNENMEEEEKKYGSYILPGTGDSKSELFVPLISGEQARGLINLSNYEREHAFSDSEVRLLQTLANSMSVALENARLFDETQRLLKETEQRAAELTIINSVQEGLASKLDIQTIYDLVGDKIRNLFDAQVLLISIFDSSGETSYVPYIVEKGERLQIESGSLTAMERYMIRTRQLLLLNERFAEQAQELFGGINIPAGEIPKSMAVIPLIVGDQVKGIISLQNVDRENAFSDSDVRLLTTLANSMSVALENARLFDETQRLFKAEQQRAAELAIINSVQEGLASKLDMKAVYDLVGDKVGEIFKADTTYIGTYHPEEQVVVSHYYVENGHHSTFDPFPMGQGLYTPIIQSRQPLLIGTSAEQQGYGSIEIPSPGSEEDLNETYLGVPIMLGEEVKGIVSVQSHRQHAFNESDVRLLQTLANSMSVALENARLFDETNRDARESVALNEVGRDISSTLNLSTVMERIASHARELLKADTSAIFLPEAGDSSYRAIVAQGVNAEEIRTDTIQAGEGIIGALAQQGKAEFINDTDKDPRSVQIPGTPQQSEERLMVAPLLAGEKVSGMMAVWREGGDPFAQADLAFLEELSLQAAIAIKNANLFDETEQRNAELAIINSVQEGLASKLDMQAIYDLVGDKIRQVFDAQVVTINSFDTDNQQSILNYGIEKGERFYDDPYPLSAGHRRFIRARQPLLINEDWEKRMRESGYPVHIAPGTETPKSTVFVPLIANNEIKGSVTLQNVDRENAFTEADVRLLTTLANSMSVALENARLFDETQRLLKETEQRNAELAIINSVQEGLASKLEMQAVIDLVGDQVRSITRAQSTLIALYTKASGLVSWPYYVIGEKRIEVPIEPLGKNLTRRVLFASEPLNLGTEQDILAHDANPPDGYTVGKSYLGVPFTIGDSILGALAIGDAYHENAFGDSDVRLLQTLANSMGVALENARLFDEVQKRNQEITNALEQQTASGEILSVIASSPTDIQPVLDTVARNAAYLCNSEDCAIFRIENKTMILAAHHGIDPTSPLGSTYPLNNETIAGRAILEKRIVHIPDLEQAGAEFPLSKSIQRTHRAFLAVPLQREGQIIGVIFIRRREAEPFSDSQIQLVKTFADQSVIAIENVRLFTETQRLLKETEQRAAELTIINSVQEGLASKLDIQAIYDLVGNKMREIFNAESIYIAVKKSAANITHFVYFVSLGTRIHDEPPTVPTGFGGRVMETRKPLLFNHIDTKVMQEYGSYFQGLEDEKNLSRSWMGAPILAGNEVIGVISIQNQHENTFTESDLRLLTTLTNSMSVALENARLFDETQRLLKETEQRAGELSTVNTISTALAGELDLNALIELVGEQVRNAFSADIVYVALLDEETNVINFLYEHGQHLEPLPLGQGLTSKIIEKRQPLLINEDIDKRREELGTSQIGVQAQSYLGVPIFVSNKAIGVISVQSTEQENVFDEDDQRLLSTIAANVGVALQNARLFDETQMRNRQITEALEQQTATSDILQVIASSPTDIQPVLDVIAQNAAQLSGSDDALIDIEDKGVLRVAAHYGNVPMYPIGGGIPFNRDSVAGRAMIQAQTLQAIHKQPGEETEYPEGDKWAHKYGYRMTCSVPLLREGKAIGAITIRRVEPDLLSQKQIALIETFADQAVIAIENVRLFNELQQRNREVTEALEQQTATSEILRVTAGSPTDIQPVLDVITQNARRLCDANQSAVYRTDGQMVYEAAISDLSSDMLQTTQELSFQLYPAPLERDSTLSARAILDRAIVHIPDLENEPDLPEITRRYVEAQTIKSALFVPMLREGEAIGCIGVGKRDPMPFTDKQIALLQTFASQAVIAIENVRLFNELQQSNREITESLEQQTATSEILSVLASSPTEIKPVLDIVAKNATRVCGAYDALVFQVHGDQLRLAAHYGPIRVAEDESVLPLDRGSVTGRAVVLGQSIHVHDIRSESESEYPVSKAVHEIDDTRTILATPLLREGLPIGAIVIRRTEVDPFTDKQANLLKTFANQAAIAIENVRLFTETERLLKETEQRAAELGIINTVQEGLASKLEVQAIYDLVGDKIRDIFHAQGTAIYLFDHEAEMTETPYCFLRERFVIEPVPFSPIARLMIRTAQPIIFRNSAEYRAIGGLVPETNDDYISGMYVPLVIGKIVKGMVSIVNLHKENVSSDSDLRLLNTLANSMSIALESTRLFDEIKSQKQYLEAVIANSPAAIVLTDQNNHVTGWNPAAERLFGYSELEAMGQNIHNLVANNEELRGEITNVEQGLKEDQANVIAQRSRKDGTLVDVEVLSLPINRENLGQGFITIYHDITELQRARQEAIAANEAKSSFLATMSHEIRTPMNAVIGMSGLLMDTNLNKEQRDYAETIRNSGDTLLAIINDILDFSKIEAGRMEVEHQPFDLRECVESALDLTAGRAIEKGLDIAYLIDDDVPAGIKSDVTRLRQILINLLSNAIKFTEKGEVVLTVKKGKAKYEIIFTVRDTGIGISESHISRLFQSFSQADSSTTRKFGGTGLGLAISKRLAEMMGGEMHVESRGIGKGSKFIFTIWAESAKIPERKTERDIKGIQSVLQDKRALIVDDNATNRRILMLQTEKWGMNSRETAHPSEALEWIQNGESFDLAILDLQMPEMDGIMLTREIRKIHREESLPIILLTSLGRREIGADDLNFAAYLTKPLKPSALYDALAGLFARSVITPKVDTAKPVMDAELGKKHPLRILLAEDNAVNQKLALRILEQMSYRADVASNGIEAIESIERQKYDVILMDVQMPEMDGLDATREIRKLVNVAQPHIVAMTANAMEGDREMCLAAGMNDYISKPIRVNELVDALMKAERK